MMNTFCIEEISIMNLYNTSNREVLIRDLKDIVSYIEDEDVKLTVRCIINKLKNISDKEFKKISFEEVLEINDIE